ncbi:hypothetical protein QMU85_003527 [Photobacterium damselae]|nr:hypothetical protein [Photobacterium damselae]
MNQELINFIYAVILTLSGTIICLKIPALSIFNHPSIPLQYCTQARLIQGLRFALLSLTLFTPLYWYLHSSTPYDALFRIVLYLSLFFCAGIIVSPQFAIKNVPDLQITSSFWQSLLNVHLAHIDKPFNISTYRQLGTVLDEAKTLHYCCIRMRSPLFCRHQEPRSFKRFERFIRQHGYILEQRPLHWYEALPNKLLLMIEKQKQAVKGEQSLALMKLDNCWYEVVLYRLS